VLQEISDLAPHVLFVGLGTPCQEKWIEEKLPGLAVPVIWAVGAMFDFVAGVEPRVPTWMNALGLEWFWRFLMDPIGKWRRYLIGNPLFIYRILRQKWSKAGPTTGAPLRGPQYDPDYVSKKRGE
jgi:N-acetylglucosaminyldiphosphoundecaprenol N-acetyl-beta-D-mannosaminyltransferase